MSARRGQGPVKSRIKGSVPAAAAFQMPILRVLSVPGRSLGGLKPPLAGFPRRTVVCFPSPQFYARPLAQTSVERRAARPACPPSLPHHFHFAPSRLRCSLPFPLTLREEPAPEIGRAHV